jgi:hypothetical protein
MSAVYSFIAVVVVGITPRYTQAVNLQKRETQSKLAETVLQRVSSSQPNQIDDQASDFMDGP